jgi:hypothetical protein
MNISLAAGEANEQLCADCAVRPLGVCAALDQAELREFNHLDCASISCRVRRYSHRRN